MAINATLPGWLPGLSLSFFACTLQLYSAACLVCVWCVVFACFSLSVSEVYILCHFAILAIFSVRNFHICQFYLSVCVWLACLVCPLTGVIYGPLSTPTFFLLYSRLFFIWVFGQNGRRRQPTENYMLMTIIIIHNKKKKENIEEIKCGMSMTNQFSIPIMFPGF